MNERRITIAKLAEFTSEVLDVPFPTVRHMARQLISAGHLPKGRAGAQGVNAAVATPREAAILLIAVAAAEGANDAVRAVEQFGLLPATGRAETTEYNNGQRTQGAIVDPWGGQVPAARPNLIEMVAGTIEPGSVGLAQQLGVLALQLTFMRIGGRPTARLELDALALDANDGRCATFHALIFESTEYAGDVGKPYGVLVVRPPEQYRTLKGSVLSVVGDYLAGYPLGGGGGDGQPFETDDEAESRSNTAA